MRTPLSERFASKHRVDQKTGCWVWTAGTNGSGYGLIRPGGLAPRELAHRVSWTLFRGAIPADESYHGVCVLHSCDNPACVNPQHLFLGTNLDNIRDRVSKNRSNRRTRNAKLTAEDVREIRRRLDEGVSGGELAARYGVSHWAVSDIKRRRYWKEISH